MMQDFFMKQIQALNENFSSPYSERQVAGLWAKYRHLSPDRFQKAVDKLILEETRRPTSAQIDSALNFNSGMDSGASEAMRPTDGSCNRCDGTGWMFVLNKQNQEFSFKCLCAAGQSIRAAIPEWDQEKHGEHFAILHRGQSRDEVIRNRAGTF